MADTFRRENRLLKTREFRRVYSYKTAFKSEFLILKVAANNLGHTRLGLVVDSRRVPHASRRNRLKRILREVFRKNRTRLKNGFDLVFSVKVDPGEGCCYGAMESLFLSLTKNARLLLWKKRLFILSCFIVIYWHHLSYNVAGFTHHVQSMR